MMGRGFLYGEPMRGGRCQRTLGPGGPHDRNPEYGRKLDREISDAILDQYINYDSKELR
jgi:hypothetical protein